MMSFDAGCRLTALRPGEPIDDPEELLRLFDAAHAAGQGRNISRLAEPSPHARAAVEGPAAPVPTASGSCRSPHLPPVPAGRWAMAQR